MDSPKAADNNAPHQDILATSETPFPTPQELRCPPRKSWRIQRQKVLQTVKNDALMLLSVLGSGMEKEKGFLRGVSPYVHMEL
ncbi:hypothetical protein A6R68_15476, partial [Neotoma lepida]